MLNLHNIVRPAIQAVNPDTRITWLSSTGATTNADGSRTPTYAPPKSDIKAQIQPPSGELLRHQDMMNVQGIIREVWMYGNPQQVVRVDAKGGDLLQFPENVGGAVQNWLVKVVIEQGWNLTDGSWSHVGVVLQTDTPIQ